MQPGKLGHLFPEVNQDLCINCKLCQKVCPSTSHLSSKYPITAFAAWHTDRNQYLTSTSGGAATAFAQTIINKGGVVYGCSSEVGLKFRHIRIDNQEDLYKLKGSKYVQSNIGYIYKDIERDLKESLQVLFLGTPCQCAGLKSYLRKNYDNLICVELICHGVPSQKLLKKHLMNISGGEADYVTFRKGNDMGLRVYDKSGHKIYYSNIWYERYRDAYYNTFIDGYTYRESCYKCAYAKPERCSDITIGDFWGLGADLQYDNVNGCSCVLPITGKGLSLIKESPLELHERHVEEAINGNEQLRHPKSLTPRIKFFRKFYSIFGWTRTYLFCELDHIIELKIINPIKRRLKL